MTKLTMLNMKRHILIGEASFLTIQKSSPKRSVIIRHFYKRCPIVIDESGYGNSYLVQERNFWVKLSCDSIMMFKSIRMLLERISW